MQAPTAVIYVVAQAQPAWQVIFERLLPVVAAGLGAGLTYLLTGRRERRSWDLSTKHRVYSELLDAVGDVLQDVQDAGERTQDRRGEIFLKSYVPNIERKRRASNAALLICNKAIRDTINALVDATHDITIAFTDASKWPDPQKATHGETWPLKVTIDALADRLLDEIRSDLGIQPLGPYTYPS